MNTPTLADIEQLLLTLNGSNLGGTRTPEDKIEITLSTVPTPLGEMIAGATQRGLCLLEFNDLNRLTKQLKRLKTRFNGHFGLDANINITPVKQQLAAYFEGNLESFDISLDTPASKFQQQVWQALQKIPYGETRSYQQQAQLISTLR